MDVILSVFGSLGVVFLWVYVALSWRKRYKDLKVDYDNLILEIHRLSEENRKLKGYTNTDPVK